MRKQLSQGNSCALLARLGGHNVTPSSMAFGRLGKALCPNAMRTIATCPSGLNPHSCGDASPPDQERDSDEVGSGERPQPDERPEQGEEHRLRWSGAPGPEWSGL